MGLILIFFAIMMAIAGTIVGICHLVQQNKQKRTEALQAKAAEMGFTFAVEADDSYIPSMDKFRLFSLGRSKKARNVLNGNAQGIDVTICDYSFVTGYGKDQRTHKQTVAHFQSSTLKLPAFSLRPENAFHMIGSLFGYQDIDFDDHPVFSERYLLRGDDEQACRELFTDKILSYYDKRYGLSTEGDGEGFLYFRRTKRIDPEDMQDFLKEAFEVFNLLTA